MKLGCKYRWLSLIHFFILIRAISSFTKVTNVNCKAFDKPFGDFEKCRLSVPKRGVIALSIHMKLFQVPVNNVTLNVSLFKKFSGYRPFLYNITIDFCAYMRNPARFPVLKLFYDAVLPASNGNHTCPYNHDIIVKNLVVKDEMFRRFPVPAGEYMFKIMVAAYNDWKADVKIYVSINLDKNG